METVGEEKLRAYKRARMAVEACEREMEEKAREVAQLQAERQRQHLQVEELESIVRLKQAEAEMFQLKANEARQVNLGIWCDVFYYVPLDVWC